MGEVVAAPASLVESSSAVEFVATFASEAARCERRNEMLAIHAAEVECVMLVRKKPKHRLLVLVVSDVGHSVRRSTMT